MTKLVKEFVAGRGYSKQDWDAVDSPELTEEEIASLRPASEILPPALYEALTRRGRGRQKAPTKALVSIRLDQDIIDRFKAAGPGWQSRINEALRKALAA
jgi:uncharacterized protein (DUF4415 family)